MSTIDERVFQLEQRFHDMALTVATHTKDIEHIREMTANHLASQSSTLGKLEKSLEKMSASFDKGVETLSNRLLDIEKSRSFAQGSWWGAAKICGAIGFIITGAYGIIRLMEYLG